MSNQGKKINGRSNSQAENTARMRFDDDLKFYSEDSALFGKISSYMKGRRDIEEVQNDPFLSETRDAVKDMIADYRKNLSDNSENEKFIHDGLSEKTPEKKIKNEIEEIKLDIGKSNISEISSEWVKEWHRKKQIAGNFDNKRDEIRDFITGSLKPEKDNSPKPERMTERKRISRRRVISYLSLSAAALIGAVIMLRTLLPSYTPEKIFDSYYKPFDAISPVTRSPGSNENTTYASAIASYKTGDYRNAASMFSESVINDPASVSAQFFLGLTQLALSDYDKAISSLAGVVKNQGEFGKEAQWYLGLAYLKTGNRTKASENFDQLAKTNGFYSERSVEILRRLK